MKFTAMDYLIAGILSYYLIKGLIFLFMWTTLGMMADKGKKTKAKQLEERKEAIRRKREIRDNTKS